MVLTPVIYWIMATQIIPLFNKERHLNMMKFLSKIIQLSLPVLVALDKLLRVLPAYSI
jgi:hypothetical protein